MIEVRYKARLGNNMFQYSLGRILAEGLGFALDAAPIDGFPRTSDIVAGDRHDGPIQVLTGQAIDLPSILADRRPRRIVLDGWFQRHEYYRPHRDRIRQWLQFDPAIPDPPETPDTVLHVRRTDFVGLGWALPFSFYEQALQSFAPPAGGLWIITDDDDDPFFLRFRRVLRFGTGSSLEQMRLMSRARRIVMSQSTFSWWPTFLGDPDTVICPVPAFGAWAADGNPNEASLIERDRFQCVNVAEPYRPTASEQAHQEWRALKRRAVLAINRRLGAGLPEPSA